MNDKVNAIASDSRPQKKDEAPKTDTENGGLPKDLQALEVGDTEEISALLIILILI